MYLVYYDVQLFYFIIVTGIADLGANAGLDTGATAGDGGGSRGVNSGANSGGAIGADPRTGGGGITIPLGRPGLSTENPPAKRQSVMASYLSRPLSTYEKTNLDK